MTTHTIDSIKEAIKSANDEEIAVAFKDLFPEVPDWESFIMLLDKEIHNSRNPINSQAPLEERAINGVIVRNLFYLFVRISDDESIKEIQSFKELFGEVFQNEIDPVGAFVNIVGGEKPGEAHRDDRETIFWQCQGASQWTIYEEPEGENYVVEDLKVKKIITLRPGSVLYLRNRGMHSVINYGPRASIAFMPRK